MKIKHPFGVAVGQFIKQNKLILLILILAAFLRILDIGRSSFWYDEVRIATSAIQPTLGQVVKLARMDVASPPLDYILVWLMGHVSLAEGWLRLPEALWGVAAVGILYAFARQLIGRFAALAAAACLALASVHIFFSQELRFYAPLFFFYWLLTWLLFRALQDPSRRNWILVIEAATLGAYFHFYTLLAFLNGFTFLLLLTRRNSQWKSIWKGFFIAGIVTVLLVLPGFLVFGLSRSMPDLQLIWGQLLPQLSIALGWLSISGNPTGNFLGACFLILAVAGLIAAILRHHWVLVSLVVSVAIQVGLLIVMDVIARYFFVTRSFLFALPVTFLLAGYALDTLSHAREIFPGISQIHIRVFPSGRLLTGIVLSTLIVLSLVEFIEIRPVIKSNARVISSYIDQTWRPGDQVWVNPDWDGLTIAFYLSVYFNDEQISNNVYGYRWENLPDPNSVTGQIFLITGALGTDLRQELKTQGFTPIQTLEGFNCCWIHSN
jgi:hypothetical protein